MRDLALLSNKLYCLVTKGRKYNESTMRSDRRPLSNNVSEIQGHTVQVDKFFVTYSVERLGVFFPCNSLKQASIRK